GEPSLRCVQFMRCNRRRRCGRASHPDEVARRSHPKVRRECFCDVIELELQRTAHDDACVDERTNIDAASIEHGRTHTLTAIPELERQPLAFEVYMAHDATGLDTSPLDLLVAAQELRDCQNLRLRQRTTAAAGDRQIRKANA